MNEWRFIYKAIYVYGLPIIGGNCHKYYFCLLWQNMSSVATKVCLLRKNFCHDKIMFIVTKYFCPDERRILLQQNTCLLQENFCCCRKYNFCCDKKTLSQQKSYLWQLLPLIPPPPPPIHLHPPPAPIPPPTPSPYTQLLLPHPCDNNSYFKCCVLQGSKLTEAFCQWRLVATEWMNDSLYIYSIKSSTQNLVWSQCQIQYIHLGSHKLKVHFKWKKKREKKRHLCQ